jgi:hypothetical protein
MAPFITGADSNITTITVRDRNTGKVTTETLIGQSPFDTSE